MAAKRRNGEEGSEGNQTTEQRTGEGKQAEPIQPAKRVETQAFRLPSFCPQSFCHPLLIPLPLGGQDARPTSPALPATVFASNN